MQEALFVGSRRRSIRRARTRLQKFCPIVAQHLRASQLDREWIEDRVILDVHDGRLEADRFTEEFNRPYGQVWTESVLLDVSPDSLDSFVTADYRAELSRQHASRPAGILPPGRSSILLTGLLYILLNIATKGYFTLRLRLAAAAIVTAVIILLTYEVSQRPQRTQRRTEE